MIRWFSGTGNLGETEEIVCVPFDVICVAYENRTSALARETDAVSILEIVYLNSVCDFLPGFNERSEPGRNLLIVAFLVGIQVAIEDATGGKAQT